MIYYILIIILSTIFIYTTSKMVHSLNECRKLELKIKQDFKNDIIIIEKK